MKIYLIPGLGFDHQIFSRLDLKEWDSQYLDWIEPLQNKSIENYSARLAQNIIPTSKEKIVLIGHSLGGIVSQEIARIKKIDKIILISSIKSRDEMPTQFKMVKPLRIYKLFTKGWTTSTVKFWGKTHDYATKEEQALFKDMVGKHSNHYLQWALKTLSIWTPHKIPLETPIFQISGDSDKTFPIKLINKPNHIIKKGGHFMVYKHPEIMNEIIHKELRN